MHRNAYWYKVDNAGKIFPAVSKESRSSVFRLSFYIDQEVDPVLLNQAVSDVLLRFETFAVTLKRGLFWYYLSHNNKPFQVKKEPSVMCKFVPWSQNNGYLFNVYYYQNKIVLEIFHSLSDGTGGMEFLKSITYRYLELRGEKLNHNQMILSQVPNSTQESVDMFKYTSDKENKKNLKEEPAYHIKGELFPHGYSLCVRAKASTDELLAVAHKYHVTLGQFIAAAMTYSIYCSDNMIHKSRKPIKMFVPVNLRKYFPSKTIRNFSLYIKTTFSTKQTLTFEDIIQGTKEQFEAQLNKKDLHQRINANVAIEDNIAVRLLPLPIKDFAFRLGYYFLAEDISTYSISNLGNVKLPTDMEQFVNQIEFSIGGTNMGVASYQGKTCFSMNSRYKDLSVIQSFIQLLTSEGVTVSIDTNYREGYDEIL